MQKRFLLTFWCEQTPDGCVSCAELFSGSLDEAVASLDASLREGGIKDVRISYCVQCNDIPMVTVVWSVPNSSVSYFSQRSAVEALTELTGQ
jgi:hypothetical protein